MALLHRVSLDVKLTEPVKVWKGMKRISKHTTHSKALDINPIRESTTKTMTTKDQFTPHHQTQTSADSRPVRHFSDIPRADKWFNWWKQAPTNASRRWHTDQTKPDQCICSICHNLSVQCELALRDTHMIHMTYMIEYKMRSFEEYNIHSFQ